jgi:hypothetical protein
MRKAVLGLAGILLSCFGCRSVYVADEEANRIKLYSESIKKIIEAGPEDSYSTYEPKKAGDPFTVVISGKNGTRIIKYRDINGDGKYEQKETTKLEIPGELELKILPPNKTIPEKKIPEKKTEPKKNMDRIT